jgi:C4-dicarboxylate-specific signal transduction histidine kinase
MCVGEKARLNADPKEERIRYIQNAIELALTLGDFQKEVNSECTPGTVARETLKRIEHIVEFETGAIYLVDEQTSDLRISSCAPAESQDFLEDEISFMIDNGFVAWAMRERRGIRLNSKDGSHSVFLHVMATYSRIRGLFIGIFPSHVAKLHDAALEMVSIILRNAANGIENLIYSSAARSHQKKLEEEVARKSSQMVHYEKQLAMAQNMEAIAVLAGGVAHQFNNALQALVGNMELISMAAQGESKILSFVERTRHTIERMSSLTSQLTAYASGGTFIASQVTAVNAFIDEILPAIKRTIKPTVELRVDLIDESLSVDVDLIQLRTVVLAIVTNADEAIADKGSIRISGRLIQWRDIPENVRSELTPGDYACICLQDNGTGMDSDTLRRLFEPFYSTKFEGRGLSMAAVSGIIQRHRGWIHVDSKIAKGTCVQIYLPAVSG